MTTSRALLLTAGLPLLLAGCTTPQPPAARIAPAPALLAESGVADPRLSGALMPEPTPPAIPYSPGRRAIDPARADMTTGGAQALPAGDISLNFVDTDIREIVKAVLGATLAVPYTIDATVQGRASITTPRPITRDQVIPMLEDLLAQDNAVLVVDQGLYQVLPASASTTRPVMGPVSGANGGGANGSGGDGGAEIVQLRYASARELDKLLEPFVSHGGKLQPDPSRNALIVAGDPLTRETLTSLIRSFDIDVLAGQSYALLPVSFDTPAKVAAALQKLLLAETDGPLAGQVRVIPMTRLNAVLVASPQPRFIAEARRVIGLVDRGSGSSGPAWHVYYVQNGQSADLEYLLQRAFTPNHVTSTGASDTNRLDTAAPGTGSSAFSTPGANGASGGTSAGSAAQTDTAAPAGAGAQIAGANGGTNGGTNGGGADLPPAIQPLSSSTGSDADSDNGISIIANKHNNALLIYASPQQYAVMQAMLEKIDIVPLQVQIDATIAEVTLNNALQYGTEFFFRNGGLVTNADTALSGGFELARGINATITALEQVTKLRVLSAPQITVLDNELASIQVGDTVPYLAQQATSTLTANSAIVSSINYQQTGVILQVIPRVNSGGLVTLDISQEVSDPVKTTVSDIDSPTFQDRKVHSRVVVQDGQTIGIGGMIRDNDSRGNSGIPLLRRIPILGALFSTQDNSRTRTELLVMITPHVIDDQRGARMLTDDLRQELKNADDVPEQLKNIPENNPDPNQQIENNVR